MKIAVYHNLPSGGGKRALYEMTCRLNRRHTIDVYSLSSSEHDFCDLRPHCRRYEIVPFSPFPFARSPFGRLNQGIRALDLLRLRRLQRMIAHRIDASDYDCVFVHNCRYGQSPSLLQSLHTTSVYYCQEPPRLLYEPPVPRPYAEFSKLQRLGNLFDPLPGLYRRTLGRLDRANVQAATRVLANSHYSLETMYRTYGIFARVVYLGVDTAKFRNLELSHEHFVLSVGALNPRKGFDFLIRILALLPPAERPPLIVVTNFSNPRERPYLENLAKEQGVLLEIRTVIDDTELVRLYNQARLVLYAPVMEPFGFVPLEAMACSTPVVGVAEGGVRESVVHGHTGLLIDREPALFADAVRALLADPARCEAYGAQAREHVLRNWSWADSTERLEQHLIEVAHIAAREGKDEE